MRWVGRVTALLFLVWLAIVILGGLGVGPAGRLPFGHVLRPSAGPPPLRHVPQPSAPAAADLVPALPAPVPSGAAATKTTTRSVTTPGKSGVAPGHTKTTATTTTTTSPGRSGAAPGHLTTTLVHGKSESAPRHAKRTTTTTSTTTTTTTVATVPGKALGHGKKP